MHRHDKPEHPPAHTGVFPDGYRVCLAVGRMALLALAASLSACGSLRLYDKSTDKLATDAATAYEDSKVAEALKAEQANFDALEKKEIDAFLRVDAARRDLELLALLSDSKTPFVERFKETIRTRVKEIAGQPPASSTGDADLAAFRNKLEDITKARIAFNETGPFEAQQRDILVRMEPKLSKMPACTLKNDALFKDATRDALRKATKDAEFEPTEALQRQYELYVTQACRPLLVAEQTLKTTNTWGGELGKAMEAADALARDLDARKVAVKDAKAVLKTATEAEAAARKAKDAATSLDDLTCPQKKDKDKEKDKAAALPNQICEALAQLKKLGDAGIKAISEEQVKKIDLLLVALSGAATDKDEKDMPAALALLSTSARFAYALKEYRTAGTYPALEPLLIEKRLQASRLAYATQGTELEKQRVAAAQEKAEALLQEGDLLLQAYAYLGGIQPPKEGCAKKNTAPYCMPVSRLVTGQALQADPRTGAEPAGRIAYRALALYAESFSVARARQQRAELKGILTGYRDSLNRSEAALASWDALIATPITQLQTYHASGLKPDELAQFLQAFGIIGIAQRVK